MAYSLGVHTPYNGTRVKEGALPRLLSLLSPVVHSWSLFAWQIGVPTVQISQIQAANSPTNPTSLYISLTQALEWWIANHHNSTYEVIISVLDPKLGETTPVMNRALAGQVRGFMAKEQAAVFMAEGIQPQKGNLAAAALWTNFTALYDALAQPLVATGLAVKLYNGAIITSEARDAIQTPGISPTQRTSLLIQAVESSIKIDHARLRKFTRVLRKQPLLEPVAKQLRQCYSALVSEASLTESSSSGSDTDSTEQHQSQEVDISGNGIPGEPSRQPPQTPPKTVPFETAPVSPVDAKTQPTRKHKAQKPYSEVKQRIAQLEQMYENLVGRTQAVVKQQSPMVDAFRQKITLLPTAVKGEYQKYLKELVPEIYRSETIEEIFGYLNLLWNYLSFGLLRHIIQVYGDEELKQQIEEYSTVVQTFREETSLHAFLSAQPKRQYLRVPADLKCHLKEVMFKHKNLTIDSSLSEVESYRQQLACEYSLPDFAVILEQIEAGSLSTVWLVPASVAATMKECVQRKRFNFLQEHKIIQMEIDGKTVYPSASVAATMKECVQRKRFDFLQEHKIIQMEIDGKTVYPSGELPPQLQRLVRIVARAFYQPQHILILDILAKYPCVTESDLIDVLKMHSGQKQLRQALTFLKKDKLIKSLQKMEKEESSLEGEKVKMVHYYYINYKQFVNVVKYKLDQMRKKIEAEERKVQNRMSYSCPRCKSTFSDLDVDRLFDHKDGNLRCSYCGSVLEEDACDTEVVDARSLISKMNDQMKPITDLLRETENINLAPEILEPETQSIQKLLQDSRESRPSGARDQTAWITRKATDLYGADQTISVNVGTEEELRQHKPVAKEQPEWMKYSTVHRSDNLVQDQPIAAAAAVAELGEQKLPFSKPVLTDHQIMADLLAHETKQTSQQIPATSFGPLAGVAISATATEYSSSSSSEDEGMMEEFGPLSQQPTQSESEEEDFAMKIGDKVVAINEVTSEMVAQMTNEERETYTKLCQQALSDYY